MKIVYRAENAIDGNLVRGLLEREGILAFVNGSYLQGGIGELPASGLVTVSVADEDFEAARRVVREFEGEVVATGEAETRDLPPGSEGLPDPAGG